MSGMIYVGWKRHHLDIVAEKCGGRLSGYSLHLSRRYAESLPNVTSIAKLNRDDGRQTHDLHVVKFVKYRLTYQA